ncbi:hypothetical protein [Curvibacter lanceolatus]|uniref:hypothetical protein n=1 Tax=Curvibacter lanceolatus TaxID=86182 RepID=UPI00035C28E1|nr:hypothetical protein [Curvibacter lanceolatus]
MTLNCVSKVGLLPILPPLAFGLEGAFFVSARQADLPKMGGEVRGGAREGQFGFNDLIMGKMDRAWDWGVEEHFSPFVDED